MLNGNINVDYMAFFKKLNVVTKPTLSKFGGPHGRLETWMLQAALPTAVRHYYNSYAASLPYLSKNQYKKYHQAAVDVGYEARTTHGEGKATGRGTQPHSDALRPLSAQVRRRAKGGEPRQVEAL